MNALTDSFRALDPRLGGAKESAVVTLSTETRVGNAVLKLCADGETRRRVYEAMHTAADDNLAVRNEPIVVSRAGEWSGSAAQRSAAQAICRQARVCVCVI